MLSLLKAMQIQMFEVLAVVSLKIRDVLDFTSSRLVNSYGRFGRDLTRTA